MEISPRAAEDSQVAADPLSVAFGELLKAARAKAGVTQEDLAHRSGLDRTTVSQVERGEASPRLNTLIRLAGGLAIEPADLIPSIRWTPPSDGPRPTGRFEVQSEIS